MDEAKTPGAAWGLSAVSLLAWGAVLGLAAAGVTGAMPFAAAAGAWVVSLVAMATASGYLKRKDPSGEYSGPGELLGALVFLVVLVPIGAIWTLGRAFRIGVQGRVDGARRGDHLDQSFDTVNIGPHGRPLAVAAAVLALGWPAFLGAMAVANPFALASVDHAGSHGVSNGSPFEVAFTEDTTRQAKHLLYFETSQGSVKSVEGEVTCSRSAGAAPRPVRASASDPAVTELREGGSTRLLLREQPVEGAGQVHCRGELRGEGWEHGSFIVKRETPLLPW